MLNIATNSKHIYHRIASEHSFKKNEQDELFVSQLSIISWIQMVRKHDSVCLHLAFRVFVPTAC